MGRLFPLLALADLALLVVALIDCLSIEDGEIRALPRVAWVFIILLFSPIGAIAWFAVGRPQRSATPRSATPRSGTQSSAAGLGVWRTGNGLSRSAPPRALAPDDDPEFLRRLSRAGRADDESRLRAWEADLRRRERELHDKELRDKKVRDKELRDKERPAPEQSTDS